MGKILRCGDLMPGCNFVARGESEGHCLVILPSALADDYATDPGMNIVTAARADALVDKWRQLKGHPAEIVTDERRIAAITAKIQAGIALSQEDRDALDPDSPVRGVSRAHIPFKEKYPNLFA